jgi:hypothetical protein
MVEFKNQSGLLMMVMDYKPVTIIEILPFFYPSEMAKFC